MFVEVLQPILMLLATFLAFLAVEANKILYAVISFSGMCMAIGALFWVLNAPYVAVFQLLIYAGAVMILFLVTIMLTSQKENLK